MVRGELEAFKWYCRDCPLPVAHSSILDEETSLRDPEMPVETDLQPTPQNTSFDITLPVETGPETPMEESVEEPIPDVIMEDEPTTMYEVIVGGSVKGGDLLADNRGYTYSRKRKSDQATTWTCSNRGKKCGATVKQQGLDSFCIGPRMLVPLGAGCLQESMYIFKSVFFIVSEYYRTLNIRGSLSLPSYSSQAHTRDCL